MTANESCDIFCFSKGLTCQVRALVLLFDRRCFALICHQLLLPDNLVSDPRDLVLTLLLLRSPMSHRCNAQRKAILPNRAILLKVPPFPPLFCSLFVSACLV